MRIFFNFARVHNVIGLWAVKFALKYITTVFIIIAIIKGKGPTNKMQVLLQTWTAPQTSLPAAICLAEGSCKN
jgi:hypothetical protein